MCVNSTKRRYSENQYREITTANWGLATTNQPTKICDPRSGSFWPQGYYLNKLGRSTPSLILCLNALCQEKILVSYFKPPLTQSAKKDLIFRQHMNSLFQQSAKARSQLKQPVIAWIYRIDLSMLKSLFRSGYKPLLIKLCGLNDLGISDTSTTFFFCSRRHSISMTVVYESKKTETRHICLPVISQLQGRVIVDL